ncbi:CrcB family protein [Cellulomonas sp. IC4_254]|uniref:fluoride efflux transporter FluC n=1 Tax=Cellulomonas sp. IC4_254 TaxID=2714040 RepID=UPI001422D9A4|nr:CrcB family protein [Cellulomonas sp. IC4_254]NHT17900.1 CrcB family protein [Cellulomonas sp. IC4_254]
MSDGPQPHRRHPPEVPTSTPAAPRTAPRPAHHRAGLALLVAVGGAVGSLGRYGLAHALPPQDGWPVGTLTANLTGAFLLGALLEVLGRRGPETPGVQRVRLALGTGVLGGYTTFSSLALETERLLASGAVGTALGYVAVSLVAGVLCAAGGVALVAALAGRRSAAGGAR